MIIKKIIFISFMIAVICFSYLNASDKINEKWLTSNEVHIGYINTDQRAAGLSMWTSNLYSKAKYRSNDRSLVSFKSEVMYVDYQYKHNTVEKPNNKIASPIIVIDELYYKYLINNRLAFIVGKIDFRTDNGSIVTLPQDRQNSINPLMSNYVADGAYLSYHSGKYITSIGVLSKGALFNSIIIGEDNMNRTVYDKLYGVSLLSNYKDETNSFSFNYFNVNGTLNNGKIIKSNIYGFNYINDQSMNSGNTYYLYGAYSDTVEGTEKYTGYAGIIGANKLFDLPYIRRDVTVGIETMILKDDFVSLNTGRFISTYSMCKNGLQLTTYMDIVATNRLHLKFRFSRFIPDGKVINLDSSLERVRDNSLEELNDLRIELQYKF